MSRLRIFFAGLFLLGAPARAQEGTWDKEGAEPVQTIWGKREMAGGYGLLSVERAKFLDDAMLSFFDLRLGWMLTRSFGVGLSTSGLVTERTSPSGEALGLSYYGVSLETTLFPHDPAHLNLVLTGGEGHLTSEDVNTGKINKRDILSFVEPEANLELNMTTWFRILIGYRRKFVSGVDTTGLADKDFSLDAFHVGFKLGQF